MEFHTDASEVAIAAVLTQRVKEGDKECEHPIAYWSRTLKTAERNWAPSDRECLAVIAALEAFRHYTLGRPVRVITDCQALCWLMEKPEPTGRLARWIIRLQQFDIEICHRAGKKHVNADALSRSNHAPAFENTLEEIPALPAFTTAAGVEQAELISDFNIEQVAEEQRKDSELNAIIEFLAKEKAQIGTRKLREKDVKFYELVNGVLCRSNAKKERLVVMPKNLRASCLAYFHDSPVGGHLGFFKTYGRLASRVYWRGMPKEVREYVRSCEKCASRKSYTQKQPGHLQPIEPGDTPFDKVVIDIKHMPVTSHGYRYAIIAVDTLTKFVVARAFKSSSAEDCAKFIFENVVLSFGVPTTIISDQAKQFLASMETELLRVLEIHHVTSSGYRPQTQGQVERFNRTFAEMLTSYVSERGNDWVEKLPQIVMAYNSSIHAATEETPFTLLFGYQYRNSYDAGIGAITGSNVKLSQSEIEKLREDAANRSRNAMSKAKQTWDRNRHSGDFDVGELVYVKQVRPVVGLAANLRKLLPQFLGPYRITSRDGAINYSCKYVGDDQQIAEKFPNFEGIHASRFKPFYTFRAEKYAGNEEQREDARETGENSEGASQSSPSLTPLAQDPFAWIPVEPSDTIQPGGGAAAGRPTTTIQASPMSQASSRNLSQQQPIDNSSAPTPPASAILSRIPRLSTPFIPPSSSTPLREGTSSGVISVEQLEAATPANQRLQSAAPTPIAPQKSSKVRARTSETASQKSQTAPKSTAKKAVEKPVRKEQSTSLSEQTSKRSQNDRREAHSAPTLNIPSTSRQETGFSAPHPVPPTRGRGRPKGSKTYKSSPSKYIKSTRSGRQPVRTKPFSGSK